MQANPRLLEAVFKVVSGIGLSSSCCGWWPRKATRPRCAKIRGVKTLAGLRRADPPRSPRGCLGGICPICPLLRRCSFLKDDSISEIEPTDVTCGRRHGDHIRSLLHRRCGGRPFGVSCSSRLLPQLQYMRGKYHKLVVGFLDYSLPALVFSLVGSPAHPLRFDESGPKLGAARVTLGQSSQHLRQHRRGTDHHVSRAERLQAQDRVGRQTRLQRRHPHRRCRGACAGDG
jgi:hypothetical protein